MKEPDLQAQWIWCRGEEKPKNFYLYARKSFLLQSSPHRGSIRMTADSRYRLWINGVHIARGPARCDPRWQCLDEWDITDRLQPGENVIAVLVHHYGEWTFSYILGRGGLLADARIQLSDGTVHQLGTDTSWRVCRAEAWETALPRMNLQLGYPEVYDARRAPEGWHLPGFDDAAWEPATLLGLPGMDPWQHLVPREIPAMMEIPYAAHRVIDSGELGIARTGHYVDLLRLIWSPSNGVACLVTFVNAPRETDAEIRAGSQDAIKLWVNGGLVISHCVTRDPAPEQESGTVRLRKGWNTVLAKIVQGEGQWHFYFRIDGAGNNELLLSGSQAGAPGTADPLRPWRIIGPFPSSSVQEGFDRAYPPEHELEFDRHYEGKTGEMIGWTSAGLTAEHLYPSVIMSREERFAGRGKAIEPIDGFIVPGTPAIVQPGAEHGRYVVVDFGKEVTGYPVIAVEGAVGGEIIDMGYAEALHTVEGEVVVAGSKGKGIVNPDRSGVHYADRYICKEGAQRFQTFEKRAFRYLQMDLRNLHGPLRVGPVSLVLSTYPVENKGAFECSDALLNRIWEIGRWTLQLTMEDAYVDCPWRERAQWWGDARIQALVNYYAFGDRALMKQGLRHIAQSQTGDGLTRGVYPAGWPGGVLPTYTMLWVISLNEYYDFTGDRDTVTELFPSVQRSIDFFERFRSTHDLLRGLPPWLFVDWADVTTSGESAAINALYYGALTAAASLAGAAGHAGGADRLKSLAVRTRAGMRSILWDDQKSCFRDTRDNDIRVSEQANCLAIEFGAAPDGSAGMVLDALMERHEAAILIGTPYAAFSMLIALARAGMHDRALKYIRTHWGAMLESGATTWWEYWEPKGSFCHGWSAGPTHFLPAEILGVKPGAPGWKVINVDPHPAGLAWARGKVPTPQGEVSVEWRSGDEFSLTLNVPVSAHVSVPRLKNGVVSVSGPGGISRPAETVPAGDGRRLAVFLGKAGEFRIVSR
jgi:alpha-L-rhamnosidase